MEPVALFHETIEDAIGSDIAALGGAKKCGAWLFGHLDPNQASATVRACLNPDRNERFSPHQVMLIKQKARDVGSFATITYEQQQLGYRVEWLDPKDEGEALRREVRDLLKAVAQKQDLIERADARKPLSVVGR